MKATPFTLASRLCSYAVTIILLLSQGCKPIQSSPLPTVTLSPAPANPPTQAVPTATLSVPTASIALPTSAPPARANIEGGEVRLNLGAVELITLSPGGEWLAAAGATHICMYDTAVFEQIWCTPANLPADYEKWGYPASGQKFIRNMVFRPDGSQIAYALWYGAIIFLDSRTGQRLDVLDCDPQNLINELLWLQDNHHLNVWSAESGVDTWDIDTGKKDGHLDADLAQIQSAAWTPDGKTAAIKLEDSGVISFWDMNTLTQTGSLDTKLPEFGFEMALAPAGTILYASVFTLMGNCGMDQGDQGWIKAWDISTGEQIFETDMHGACMQSISVSPDGYW